LQSESKAQPGFLGHQNPLEISSDFINSQPQIGISPLNNFGGALSTSQPHSQIQNDYNLGVEDVIHSSDDEFFRKNSRGGL